MSMLDTSSSLSSWTWAHSSISAFLCFKSNSQKIKQTDKFFISFSLLYRKSKWNLLRLLSSATSKATSLQQENVWPISTTGQQHKFSLLAFPFWREQTKIHLQANSYYMLLSSNIEGFKKSLIMRTQNLSKKMVILTNWNSVAAPAPASAFLSAPANEQVEIEQDSQKPILFPRYFIRKNFCCSFPP